MRVSESVAAAFLLLLAGCRRDPVSQVATDAPLVSLAVSSSHVCGVTAAGAAFCWGEASSGQLGNGSTEYTNRVVPVTGGHRWAQLAVAFVRTCGITTDGAAYCWGSNPRSELIRGLKALEQSRRGVPVPVAEDRRFSAIGVGGDYACGLTREGALICWGTRGAVELGREFTTLAVGDTHACALDAAGRAWCWGQGTNGELGNGSLTRTAVPVPVAGSLSFATISVGERFTCGTTGSGEAYCWGQNQLRQLGVPTDERCGGDAPCAQRPVRVPVSAILRSVSAGDARTCALTAGSTVYCWGGGPKAIVNRWVNDTGAPRLVSLGRPFRSVSVGGHRACGLTTAGEAVCWSASRGLPEDPAGREGSRLVTRWFLVWGLGGALVGVLAALLGTATRRAAERGAWGAASLVLGALGGAAVGMVLAVVIGFFKVIESIW